MTNMRQTSTWYRTELEAIFQIVVKCGFITKPLLSDLFSIQNQRTVDRLSLAVSQSNFFDTYLRTLDFQGWRLSRAGKYECRSRGLTASYPPQISSRFHDEMAISIAVRLQRLGLVTDWSPESQFIVQPSNRLMVSNDNRGQKYPDLVLTLSISGLPLRVAVELELSRKSLSRYEKALTGYKAVRGVEVVIFAVNSSAIRSAIESALRRTRFDQNRLPILFVDAQAFRKNPANTCLEGNTWSGTFSSIAALKAGSHAA